MQGTIENYVLDMVDSQKKTPLNVKQGDTNSRWARITLKAFGDPWLIPDDCLAFINVKKTDNTIVQDDCTIEEPNVVLAPITDQTTAVPGIQQAELYFLAVDGDIKSQTFPINVYPAIMDQRVIESSNEFGTLQTAIIGAQEATRTAQDAASEAMVQAGEAREAAEIAIDAAASLDVAVKAAAAAKTSETNAKASETAAAQSKADVEALKAAFAGYNKVESGRKYANALTTTAEGDGEVVVKDAWEAPVANLEVDGASEQVVTTGTQLLDFDAWRQVTRVINGTGVFWNGRVTLTAGSNGDAFTNYGEDTLKIPVKKNTTYTLSWEYSGAEGRVYIFRNGKDDSKKMVLNSAKKLEIDTEDADFLTVRVGAQAPNAIVSYWNIMLNEGTTAQPWEPYTGGKPSPSPDYPQEIVNVAHVANSGAQLFDASKLNSKTHNGITFTANSDGSVTANGVATGQAIFYLVTASEDRTPLLGELFLSGCPLGGSADTYGLQCYNYDGANGLKKDTGSGVGFTLTNDIDNFNIVIYVNNGVTLNNVVFKPMLNAGSPPIPREPYNGQQREIDLEVESAGAQLFDAGKLSASASIDCTVSEKGKTITVSGSKAFGNASADIPIHLIVGKKIYLSGEIINTNKDIRATAQILTTEADGEHYYSLDTSGTQMIDIPSDVRKASLKLYPNNTVNSLGPPNTVTFRNIMVSYDESATWEPYRRQKVTIPLTEPLHGIGDVKDRFCMHDGVWGIERQFVKIVLNGTESWASYANVGSKSFGVSTYDNIIKKGENLLCDSLSKDDEVSVWKGKRSNTISVDTANTDHRLRVYLDETTTLQSLKDKFAANPVTVIAERAEPLWDPFPESTQAALNALTTHPGTTYLTVTSTDISAPMRLDYVQDTRKVIDGLKLDVAEQMVELQAQIDQLKVTNNLS